MEEDNDALIMISGMAHMAFPDEVENIITNLRLLEEKMRDIISKCNIKPEPPQELMMVMAKSLVFAAVHSTIGRNQ